MREVMIDVTSHNSITLAHNTLTTLNVTVSGTMNLTLLAPMQTKGSVLLNLDGNGELNLRIDVDRDSTWSMLFNNDSTESIKVIENWGIKQNSSVSLAIGELTAGNHEKAATYHLLEEGASIFVRGASLIQSTLKATHTAIHHKGKTSAQLDNYSIVLKGCEYLLEVVGKIEKAAKGAKTHQISRVMNFDEKPKTTVNPKLIIDENEVEASHAASMGQPDVNQVYYLQSRGMSRSESLKLITLGYLLPIIDVIDDESIKERLSEEILKKVSESCLM